MVLNQSSDPSASGTNEPASSWSPIALLRQALEVFVEAFARFNKDDGWAIASHIALSALMAMFPFMLVLTAIAGVFGSKDLADEGARILLETWPEEVAAPIAVEIHGVLLSAGSGVLTVGAMLALYFASSGIESLRIGLNRAYNLTDIRRWWLLRLESILYVIIGAFALTLLSFLVFLAPLIWATTVRYLPQLQAIGWIITFTRFVVASLGLIAALLIVHLWLPTGHRSLREILPGVAATLVLWLCGGTIFGRYLADFAFTYSHYYAGLASPMIALAFLYLSSAIFILGGELNNVIYERAHREGPDREL
jgi:membrane protein